MVARLKDVNGTFLVALIDVLNCLVIVARVLFSTRWQMLKVSDSMAAQ